MSEKKANDFGNKGKKKQIVGKKTKKEESFCLDEAAAEGWDVSL